MKKGEDGGVSIAGHFSKKNAFGEEGSDKTEGPVNLVSKRQSQHGKQLAE